MTLSAQGGWSRPYGSRRHPRGLAVPPALSTRRVRPGPLLSWLSRPRSLPSGCSRSTTTAGEASSARAGAPTRRNLAARPGHPHPAIYPLVPPTLPARGHVRGKLPQACS